MAYEAAGILDTADLAAEAMETFSERLKLPSQDFLPRPEEDAS